MMKHISFEEYLANCPTYSDGNQEIEDAWFDFDPVYAQTTNAKNVDAEIKMLRHMQEVVWIDNSEVFFEVIYSKNHQLKNDTNLIPMHRFIFDRCFSNAKIKRSEWCKPTLSLRTLSTSSNSYLKFGLPFNYGGGPRYLSRNEILRSLFFSDYLSCVSRHKKISYMFDNVGYCANVVRNFSVLSRSGSLSGQNFIPVGCAFGKLIKNYLNQKSEKNKSLLHDFIASLIKDVSLICVDLLDKGIGLEFHGQNLLVTTNYSANSDLVYLYRDMGNCSFDIENSNIQLSELKDFYKIKHGHTFDFEKFEVQHSIWRTIRSFFYGYIAYNMDKYAVNSNINYYAYITTLVNPEIKSIIE